MFPLLPSSSSPPPRLFFSFSHFLFRYLLAVNPSADEIHDPQHVVPKSLVSIARKEKGRIVVVRVTEGITNQSAKNAGKNTSALAVASILAKHRNDENVLGVVLRVASPGGDPVAADTIRKAVLAFGKDKPIVCSMGDLAASAGYYVSSPCHKIYASPFTLTGSIGVFGGKWSAAELSKKLGINFAVISASKHATYATPFSEFTPEQRKIVKERMHETYEVFKNVVSEVRRAEEEGMEEKE